MPRTMLDMVLWIRAAHEDRVTLSNDRTVVTKWAAVILPGLLAIQEAPFEPPVFVPPGPILEVLRQVPA